MKWEFDSNTPIYLQIVEILKSEIINGTYKPSEKFPTVRELAVKASVNPNTMQKALATLEREGFLITNRTTGRIVTDDFTKILETKENVVEEKITIFLEEMKKLGFEKEEVLKLIKENNYGINKD